MNWTRYLLTLTAVSLLIFTQACDQKEPANPPVGIDSNGGGLLKLNNVDNYFLELAQWQDLSKPVPDDPGTAKGDPKTTTEGSYECTNQEYSLAKTPDAIVAFDNSSANLWPGSLVQGARYLDGYFEAVPIAEQAPIALTINLSIPEPFVNVTNPSKQTMQNAIATLVGRAKDTPLPAEASYHFKEVYSLEQLLLDFNLSAKYMSQNAKASLKVDNKVETKTVSAYFVQTMFTVTVPTPRTPSSYFVDVTMEDIEDQEAQGRIGRTNPPLYVESVSYGRVLLFTLTSKASTSDIQAALDYSYKGGADIDAKTKAHYNNILSSAEINVVPYGGPYAEAAKLIRSANIKDYFSNTAPPLTTAVPISYKLNTLARSTTAAISETTTYTQQDCHLKQAAVIKKNGTFTLQYVGGGDNRYLSTAEWSQVGLAGKWPYPTLQLRPIKLKFKGGSDSMTSGTNIRFKTLETKAQGKKIGIYNELGAWNAKKYVFYDKSDSSSKQNWIFTKTCGKKCDKKIRYGDKVHIRNQKKSTQYLCNDSKKKTHFLVTKKSKCTWKINK